MQVSLSGIEPMIVAICCALLWHIHEYEARSGIKYALKSPAGTHPTGDGSGKLRNSH